MKIDKAEGKFAIVGTKAQAFEAVGDRVNRALLRETLEAGEGVAVQRSSERRNGRRHENDIRCRATVGGEHRELVCAVQNEPDGLIRWRPSSQTSDVGSAVGAIEVCEGVACVGEYKRRHQEQ